MSITKCSMIFSIVCIHVLQSFSLQLQLQINLLRTWFQHGLSTSSLNAV